MLRLTFTVNALRGDPVEFNKAYTVTGVKFGELAAKLLLRIQQEIDPVQCDYQDILVGLGELANGENLYSHTDMADMQESFRLTLEEFTPNTLVDAATHDIEAGELNFNEVVEAIQNGVVRQEGLTWWQDVGEHPRSPDRELYSKMYASWAAEYRQAVEQSARSVISMIDLETEMELQEHVKELLDATADDYWFDGLMSQEHAAAICLWNSGCPSAELFNHGLSSNKMVDAFPLDVCAAAAFVVDVEITMYRLLAIENGYTDADLFSAALRSFNEEQTNEC